MSDVTCGEILDELGDRAGLSQTQLSLLLKASTRNLQKIRNEGYRPPTAWLLKLLQRLSELPSWSQKLNRSAEELKQIQQEIAQKVQVLLEACYRQNTASVFEVVRSNFRSRGLVDTCSSPEHELEVATAIAELATHLTHARERVGLTRECFDATSPCTVGCHKLERGTTLSSQRLEFAVHSLNDIGRGLDFCGYTGEPRTAADKSAQTIQAWLSRRGEREAIEGYRRYQRRFTASKNESRTTEPLDPPADHLRLALLLREARWKTPTRAGGEITTLAEVARQLEPRLTWRTLGGTLAAPHSQGATSSGEYDTPFWLAVEIRRIEDAVFTEGFRRLHIVEELIDFYALPEHIHEEATRLLEGIETAAKTAYIQHLVSTSHADSEIDKDSPNIYLGLLMYVARKGNGVPRQSLAQVLGCNVLALERMERGQAFSSDSDIALALLAMEALDAPINTVQLMVELVDQLSKHPQQKSTRQTASPQRRARSEKPETPPLLEHEHALQLAREYLARSEGGVPAAVRSARSRLTSRLEKRREELAAEYESWINDRNAGKAWWSPAAAQQALLVHRAWSASYLPQRMKTQRVLLAPSTLAALQNGDAFQTPCAFYGAVHVLALLGAESETLTVAEERAREAMRAGDLAPEAAKEQYREWLRHALKRNEAREWAINEAAEAWYERFASGHLQEEIAAAGGLSVRNLARLEIGQAGCDADWAEAGEGLAHWRGDCPVEKAAQAVGVLPDNWSAIETGDGRAYPEVVAQVAAAMPSSAPTARAFLRLLALQDAQSRPRKATRGTRTRKPTEPPEPPENGTGPGKESLDDTIEYAGPDRELLLRLYHSMPPSAEKAEFRKRLRKHGAKSVTILTRLGLASNLDQRHFDHAWQLIAALPPPKEDKPRDLAWLLRALRENARGSLPKDSTDARLLAATKYLERRLNYPSLVSWLEIVQWLGVREQLDGWALLQLLHPANSEAALARWPPHTPLESAAPSSELLNSIYQPLQLATPPPRHPRPPVVRARVKKPAQEEVQEPAKEQVQKRVEKPRPASKPTSPPKRRKIVGFEQERGVNAPHYPKWRALGWPQISRAVWEVFNERDVTTAKCADLAGVSPELLEELLIGRGHESFARLRQVEMLIERLGILQRFPGALTTLEEHRARLRDALRRGASDTHQRHFPGWRGSPWPELGAQLAEARESNDITQEALAAELGCDVVEVERVEKGAAYQEPQLLELAGTLVQRWGLSAEPWLGEGGAIARERREPYFAYHDFLREQFLLQDPVPDSRLVEVAVASYRTRRSLGMARTDVAACTDVAAPVLARLRRGNN